MVAALLQPLLHQGCPALAAARNLTLVVRTWLLQC
jgi:hypothetical protein